MSLASGQARYEPRRSIINVEEPSQLWTTARCHRLLRPLVSRIASLRKDNAVSARQKTTELSSAPRVVSVPSITKNNYGEEPSIEAGCLMPKRKRPRLTYAQKRGTRSAQATGADQTRPILDSPDHDGGLPTVTKSSAKKAFKSVQPDRRRGVTNPGEIVPSTPMLRRARGEVVLSPETSVPELKLGLNLPGVERGHRMRTGSIAQKHLEERLITLRGSNPSKYADLEAIYRSFEALLKATMAVNMQACGPRSLLDMCLRTVPRYITELEAWEKFDAEQNGTVSTLDGINISAQIYNDLESLGTNVGWRHLRVVVRTDGVNAVKGGIEESLFGDEFSQLLIDLCIQLSANPEAEDLIAALVNQQYPQPTSTDSRFGPTPAFLPLMKLNAFADRTQRVSFLFKQYSTLLSSGSLPLCWLATTEFERIWNFAFKGLASANPNRDAIGFIAQAISTLSSRSHMLCDDDNTVQPEQDMTKAIQRTLVSALTIIASMALLGGTRNIVPEALESCTWRTTVIGYRVGYIIRACIFEVECHTRGRNIQKLELLYLALFLSSERGNNEKVGARVRRSIGKLSPSVLASLSNKNIRTRNHYDNISRLIASIARVCGRGASVASHQFLDGLFKQMSSLKLDPPLLDNLKAAAAFSIAQQTNNVKDLIYAESLHPHDRSSPGISGDEHHKRTLFTGYRWEETIGEWVTASPVVKKRRVSGGRGLRSSISTGRTSNLAPWPTGSTNLVIDSASDTGTDPDLETCDSGNNTDENNRLVWNGQGVRMMKKRPRRLQSTDTLSMMSTEKAVVPQQNPTMPAYQKLPGSQTDPEKENRVRLLAKKPRRSSGRVILGMRSLSPDSMERRHSRSQHGHASDDELCI